MKTILLLLFTVISFLTSYSQIQFQSEIITANANGANAVFAADLDGDGDADVLSSSSLDNTIAWYENTDGQGTFSTPHTISTNANEARSVYPADIDGDGDMDVVYGFYLEGKIVWQENTDGQGSFGVEQTITTNAEGAISVLANDLDGDGDVDILSASYLDSKIAWYENTDGQGSFGLQQTITFDAMEAYAVYAADLDGDGDTDVLSASSLDNTIAWYENTNGQGSFGAKQTISTSMIEATSVNAADLDGDGDMDVLSTSFADDVLAWYENTDGQGTFGSQNIISTNADAPYSSYATDLDGDGDLDVVSASAADDKIAWYENLNGMGSFGSQQTISSDAVGALSVFAVDVDGDGDMDVLSASYTDDKIALHKNSSTVGLEENQHEKFSLYPIPTNDIINIKTMKDIVQIEIYNQLGQLVLSNSSSNKIDISNLIQGHYFIKAKLKNGNSGMGKVIKN